MADDAGVVATVQRTEWVVITGPPSAGKTSVINALAQRGHRVVAETARHYIASLGHSAREIAADRGLQRRLQREISRRQAGIEEALVPDETVFLDRALPDSLAYFARLGLMTAELLPRATRYRYRRVFFLDGLPLDADGVRFERADEAAELAEQIFDAYAGLGYRPIRVPVFEGEEPGHAVDRRVAFILEHSRA
jgi:predicted ATPase